jgi:hypothetical protein
VIGGSQLLNPQREPVGWVQDGEVAPPVCSVEGENRVTQGAHHCAPVSEQSDMMDHTCAITNATLAWFAASQATIAIRAVVSG